MNWYEKIVSVHTSVTDSVSHGHRMKSDRYFVWQEEGSDSFDADNHHCEAAVSGTTDLFTTLEFDPGKVAFEAQLDACADIVWSLNSIQFEEERGIWHYEWLWSVI